jgi:hypothetical protein
MFIKHAKYVLDLHRLSRIQKQFMLGKQENSTYRPGNVDEMQMLVVLGEFYTCFDRICHQIFHFAIQFSPIQ